MEESSAKLFCCLSVRRRIPLTNREELYHILRMAGPLLLGHILDFMLPFVTTVFCGRMGIDVLAGYGLATAAMGMAVAATGIGLTMACDTLVSQIFGGKNLLRVGVILQRGIIILMLFCLPSWGLLINAQPILLCLGQPPEVARIAQVYITAFLPAVPAMFLHQIQVAYLKNQGITLPQMYTAALANVANVATNFIFLYWLDLGVIGSAAANSLSQIYICTFLFAYICWRKLYITTWGGWSVESLQEWGSFMRLAIPSTLMLCFDWWIYEIGDFFAGIFGEEELAAQHVVMMVIIIDYMIPLTLHAVVCARVGNALGAGDTAWARLTSKLCFILIVITGIVKFLVLVSSKTVIGFIFTSDEKIVALVSEFMTAYCVIQFFDGLLCVSMGIFLGMGRQKIPAVGNFIGYYCIGLPLAVTFMFVAKLGVIGFWISILICACFQSLAYLTVIFKLNWEKITKEAVKRAQKKTHLHSCTDDDEGDDSADRGASSCISVDGYIAASTDDHDEPAETVARTVQQMKGGRLSTTQLILRRGLTVLISVLLLVVGASVHFLVPLPEILPSDANSTMDWINATYASDQILSTVLDPK